MGAEDVADMKSAKKQTEATEHVRENLKNAKEMTKAEAGIARVNRFFGKITRAKLSSPLIEYYRQISKERKR